jgi:hypothetical protein
VDFLRFLEISQNIHFVIILIHAGIYHSFRGNEPLFKEAFEVCVPLDVAGAADHILQRSGPAIVVGDGAGDRIVVVLEKFVGPDGYRWDRVREFGQWS